MPKKIKSRLVITQVIKYLLVFLALVTSILTGYYIIVNQDSKIRHESFSDDNSDQISDTTFQVNNPNLVGINIENGPYYINAYSMEEVSGIVSFINPVVKIMLKHADWFNVISNSATLEIKSSNLQFFGSVKANYNNLYYFQGEQAEVIKNDGIVKSKQLSKLFFEENNLEAQNGFLLKHNNETVSFYGRINANIKQKDEQFVTNIKSDNLDISWSKKSGDFLGNVILLRNGTKVEADKMIAIADNNTNKLDKIYAYGNVKITDKNHSSTSEYGEYDAYSSIITLKKNVKLYKDKNTLTGELLHYNFITKKADLVGSSNKSGNNRVQAIIIPK